MAEPATDPHQDKIRTVPLPDGDDGADVVIGQENNSPEVAVGSGEWPSPETPPTGPAPGDGNDADAPTAGERGPARLSDRAMDEAVDDDGEFPPLREALEADAVAGGSKAVPGEGGDDRPAGDVRPAWPPPPD